jgi:hypothetical protein
MKLAPKVLPKMSDVAPKEIKRGIPFKARKKLPNEATVRSIDIWASGVYDGGDLTRQPSRPGSMDAYSIPSLGVST